MKYDLTFITPCYNQGMYLEDCLKSIYANRTSLKYEIVVINDCSTDNTHDIITELEKTYRFRYIQNETNQKLPETRNIGLRNSDSKYVICLDADDMIPPNYIESNYINIITNDVDISYNDSQCFGSSDMRLTWPEFNLDYLRYGPFIHCAAMYKREIWNKTQYDKHMIHGWEDYDFWLSAAKNGAKIKKCNRTYLFYRQKAHSMITDTNSKLDTVVKPMLRAKHPGFYVG